MPHPLSCGRQNKFKICYLPSNYLQKAFLKASQTFGGTKEDMRSGENDAICFIIVELV